MTTDKITRGSGNVFADINLDQPELRQQYADFNMVIAQMEHKAAMLNLFATMQALNTAKDVAGYEQAATLIKNEKKAIERIRKKKKADNWPNLDNPNRIIKEDAKK